MWCRCAPKNSYLYESDIYTSTKETAESGLCESVVLQLTEKLNGCFCCILFDNFFHFAVAPEKIDKQLTVWDRGCSTKLKAVIKK